MNASRPTVVLDEYRRLVESLTDYAIFSLSVEGNIESWNLGAQLTFGYDPSDVLGRHYSLIFSAEDVAAGQPARELAAAVASGKAVCDGWHVRRDGSRLWCTDTVQPVRDAAGAIAGFTKIVHDTTQHHLAQQALIESEERLRLLIESVADYAIFSIDARGSIVLWNSGAQNLFGYSAAQVVGRDFAELYTDEAVKRNVPQIELATAAKEGRAFDNGWHRRSDGQRFFASGTLERLEPDANGRPRGFVKIARDVTARRELDETMRLLAFSDELTQLPNRAAFSDALRRTIAQSQEYPEERFAVIFIDLDRFKLVNDSLGHGLADVLLIHIARTLEGCVRPGDVVARLGGDEFTVLLPCLANVGEASAIAERMQAALGKPIELGGLEVSTTASMGIAYGPGAYESAEEVLRDADTAMYEAKAHGRNRHVIFDDEMHARAVGLLSLQADLRGALRGSQFRLYYQPVVALETGCVRGFEALIRWEHPTRGTLFPGAFIAAAENLGLIAEIDRFVLEEAARQLAAWRRSPNARTIVMTVNVSSTIFASDDFVDSMRDLLQRHRLPPACLTLEITETILMRDVDGVAMTVARLADLGINVSLDDFGTGYSSLSDLTRLPLQVLKIDRSFVARAAEDPRSAELARTIVTLARNLGLKAIAEGIETQTQLDVLRTTGCAYGQGFWFSPAVLPDEAERSIGDTLPSLCDRETVR